MGYDGTLAALDNIRKGYDEAATQCKAKLQVQLNDPPPAPPIMDAEEELNMSMALAEAIPNLDDEEEVFEDDEIGVNIFIKCANGYYAYRTGDNIQSCLSICSIFYYAKTLLIHYLTDGFSGNKFVEISMSYYLLLRIKHGSTGHFSTSHLIMKFITHKT